MVRAGRWSGVDWLIRATHNRCLAEGDKLWDRLAKGTALGEVTFTLRLSRGSRAVVQREGDYLRFIALHTDHDGAYGKR